VTAGTAVAVQQIDATRLLPHPANPRPDLTEAEVADLRASIEQHGQAQPCVVRPLPDTGDETDGGRPAGKFEVVIGHRRAFVGRLLGRTVPCLVEDLNDDEAAALMLSDNRVRTDPDPVLESRAVAALLARQGWTLRSVAKALGKSMPWVAARAAIRTLVPKLAAKMQKAGWPVDCMELVARLAPEAQEWLLATRGVDAGPSREWLQRVVGERCKSFANAQWDLADATLVPKAGACIGCPKNSAAAPGLFDDGEPVSEEAKPGKKALFSIVCRDAQCWSLKVAAAMKRQIDETLAAGKPVYISGGGYEWRKQLPKWTVGLKEAHGHSGEWKDSKKDAADAALVVEFNYSSARIDSLHWIKDPKVAAVAKKEKAAKVAKAKRTESPAEVLAASREKIARRRRAFVAAGAKELIDAMEVFPTHALDEEHPHAKAIGLFLAFGDGNQGPPFYQRLDERKSDYALITKQCGDGLDMVWERVKDGILNAFRVNDTDEHHALVMWLAPILRLDLAPLEAQAVEEIPDPKSWARLAKEVAEAKGKKGGKAKVAGKAGKGKPARATEKACRQCGCTEDRACNGGCGWTRDPKTRKATDLCTACAEKNATCKPCMGTGLTGSGDCRACGGSGASPASEEE
jgi:ParB/RepB/Spo0J family partition protein